MANDIIITPISASIEFSGSNTSTIRLNVDASGSILFSGNSGSLFGITDNLSGSLMSVNTIAGLPILEVFSDNNVNIGKYNGEAIRVTGSGVDVMLGSGSVLFVSSSKNVGINVTRFDTTAAEALLVSGSTYNIISADANLNNYAQTHVQNFNAGTAASSDVVTTNNAGTELGNYVDMGINSSGYTAAFIGAANDGYIYNTGSDFFVGNASPGRGLFLFVGGVTNTASIFLSSSGNVGIGTTGVTANRLTVQGNISASSFTGSISGSITTALTASSLTVANSYLVANLSASVGLSSSLLRAATITGSNVGIVTGLTVGGATVLNGTATINNTLSASGTITLGITNVRGALSASSVTASVISASASITSSGLLINGNISASGLITASSIWGTGQLVYQEFHATGSLLADALFSSSATTGSDVVMTVRGNTLTGSSIGIVIDVSGSQTSFAISASRGEIIGTIFSGSRFSGSFTGSAFGTASWATSASWAPGGGGLSGGTTNYIPLWTGATSQGSSVISQSGNLIAVSGSLNVSRSVTASIYTGSNFIGSITTISSSATTAVDLRYGLTQMQLSQSITTLNHSNTNNGLVTWMLATVGAGTAVTVTWPTSYKWPGGVAPSLTTTAGKRDVYQFMSYDGASTSTGYVFATVVAQNM
jgi:hypothetical protein